MAGRVEGRVALITGGARGQGRSHALRLAQEGADIIVLDACKQIGTVPYGLATEEDLRDTAKQVEELGRRVIAVTADVRDYDAVAGAVEGAVSELGRLDIVCANAGINSYGKAIELTETQWRDVMDVNLTGVWHTIKAAAPHVIRGERGGSIIITSSGAGIKAFQNLGHYTSTKHAVVGLMRTLAIELAPHSIRVNTVHPGNVATDMLLNDPTYQLFRPEVPNATQSDAIEVFKTTFLLPITWQEASDISDAVLFLASDEAAHITGIMLPVDAGVTAK
jgi:(+)-trans-carveol dehydrogenase